MKKTISLSMMLIFSVLLYAQDYNYEIDENGKILAKHATELNGFSQPNNDVPEELMLDWSSPDINISENQNEDSWSTRMTVHPNGNAYIVYNDNHPNGLQKIMFRKKVEGEDWTDAFFVDAGGEIGGRNNHFPAIDVSANGDLHVSYNVWAYENVRNYIGYSYYNAATDTWSDGLKISDAGGTVNHTTGHHDIYSTDDNLPVVVWGYDFRENEVNEEIYMTYFDGTDWSDDIAVSDINDGQDAGYPNIASIGENKAMIIYSEGPSNAIQLKYRIYDETTNQLATPKVITSENIMRNNYALTVSPTGDIMILTAHKAPGNAIDILSVYDYDRTADAFSLNSETLEIPANAGQMYKNIAFDCNTNGDCAVVFCDYLTESCSYLEYSSETGFTDPTVIIEEKPDLIDAPTALFDAGGNLHVNWVDFRFDNGQGWNTREVFYKKGVNMSIGIDDQLFSSIAVFPNPSQGTFTIATQEAFNLEIVDVLGKVVHTETVSGTTQIHHKLPTGTYFLRFSNENDSMVKKLIVK